MKIAKKKLEESKNTMRKIQFQIKRDWKNKQNLVKIGHVRNDSAVLTSTSFTIEDRQYKL